MRALVVALTVAALAVLTACGNPEPDRPGAARGARHGPRRHAGAHPAGPLRRTCHACRAHRTAPRRVGAHRDDRAAYTPKAPTTGTDDYHCFVLDPAVTRDAFVTGFDIAPGQPPRCTT